MLEMVNHPVQISVAPSARITNKVMGALDPQIGLLEGSPFVLGDQICRPSVIQALIAP
jgi:hypothetical protein